MKIDKGSFINDFIDKNLRQYSIPVYQRNYEWSAEQCEKLFEDILQAQFLMSLDILPDLCLLVGDAVRFLCIVFQVLVGQSQVHGCPVGLLFFLLCHGMFHLLAR